MSTCFWIKGAEKKILIREGSNRILILVGTLKRFFRVITKIFSEIICSMKENHNYWKIIIAETN